jgi:hypothetical protein
MIAARHRELVASLRPHRREDDDAVDHSERVTVALSDLLDSVPAKRLGEAEQASRLDSLLKLFDKRPGWAIKQACRDIRLGNAEIRRGDDMVRLPVSYAATDGEIAEVIGRLVAPYEREATELATLLARPLDPPKIAARDPAHDERVAAGLKALSGHMALAARAQEIADAISAEQAREDYRHHAARVAADIEQRKIAREELGK